MSIVKVTEVIASSSKGFDDAAQNAVKEASKTVRGIKSVWIKSFQCTVDGGKISEYRVTAKISFLLEGAR